MSEIKALMDLQAMSNLELRKVIAEMKGYTDIGIYEWPTGGFFVNGCKPNEIYATPIPNYPESISDAYALEEDLKADSYNITLFVNSNTCHIDKIIDNDMAEIICIISSDTMPRAICEAYVLTMQGEEE